MLWLDIKSVTLNGIVCINRVRRIKHPVHRIEHPVCQMEHRVHRKYPIMYILIGVVPIEPFIMHIKVLKNPGKTKKTKKHQSNKFWSFFTSILSSSMSVQWHIEVPIETTSLRVIVVYPYSTWRSLV